MIFLLKKYLRDNKNIGNIVLLFIIIAYNGIIVHWINAYYNIPNDTFSNMSSVVIISALIIAPILEEVVCRGFLSKKRIMGFTLIPLFPVLAYVFNYNIAALVFLCLVAIFLVLIYSNQERFSNFFNNYRFVLVVFSSTVFSLAHTIGLIKYMSHNEAAFFV